MEVQNFKGKEDISHKLTEEQMCNEYNYYASQKLVNKMIKLGIITIDESDKIEEKNRQVFSPVFADIMLKKT